MSLNQPWMKMRSAIIFERFFKAPKGDNFHKSIICSTKEEHNVWTALGAFELDSKIYGGRSHDRNHSHNVVRRSSNLANLMLEMQNYEEDVMEVRSQSHLTQVFSRSASKDSSNHSPIISIPSVKEVDRGKRRKNLCHHNFHQNLKAYYKS